MLSLVKRGGSGFLTLVVVATRLASMPLDLMALACSWLKFRFVDFEPRPDDIFLVAYPGSGLLLLQMMLVELTSDGDDGFAHIAERIPWFERMAQAGTDVRAMESPRVFKSHLPARRMPAGAGKCVYLLRDPGDVAVAAFHLHHPDALDPESRFLQFSERFIRGRLPYGGWVSHVAGWWGRDGPDVLFIRYADAVADTEGTLRRVADFCGLELDENRLDEILSRCSYDSMRAQAGRFDISFELLREKGVTSGVFIRSGQVGEGDAWLTPEYRRRLDASLRRRVDMTTAEFRDASARPRRDGGE